MDTVVIGCRTLENELNQAMEECACSYDVLWVESGLHNVPAKLNQALQKVLDATQGYSLALVAMGYCGNSLAGLHNNDMTLIIPRVDDCISLLLGSYRNRLAHMQESKSYFLTEGWLKGERNIWREYQYTIERYGEKKGRAIFDSMLRHYQSLALLDTGCYDIFAVEDEVRKIAFTLGLEYRVLSASIDYIKKLLTGPWDKETFLSIPPHTVIRESDLTLPE